MTTPRDAGALAAVLAAAGFVAAEEEARELLAAPGDPDELVRRRLTGEPLAWITGTTEFCGLTVRVDPGVYVPRLHTETLAHRAVARLPDGGTAIDLCTGAGAIAMTLSRHRPRARVVATDVDERAVACARANGVEAFQGDLFAPLPPGRRADVVTAVVPYVPTPELPLLQRDTFTFESTLAYDGGPDGLGVVRRVLAEAPAHGDVLLLELGGDQAAALGLADHAFTDEDGDVRGVELLLGGLERGDGV